MFLVIGGERDPNIFSLATALEQMSIPCDLILLGNVNNATLLWNIKEDKLIVNGRVINPTAVFIRQDIFTYLDDNNENSRLRAEIWYETMTGWLMAHPKVRWFNRNYRGMNKCANLSLAHEVGFEVPDTIVSNDLRLLRQLEASEFITKPVGGGDYTIVLDKYLENKTEIESVFHFPTFVQPKLIQPEMRLFMVGKTPIAYWVKSPSLDYRLHQDAQLELVENPPMHLVEKLRKLMKILQMDYSAADLKTDPETNELQFLEINSSPMFTAFDQVSGHAVSKAIIEWHTENVPALI